LTSAAWAQTPVKVGVLANKGIDRCIKEWTPTVQYLDDHVPGFSFSLVPLEFGEIAQEVKQGRVEFVLANSSVYVELENEFGISRLATIKKPATTGAYSLFGGVIFTRADRRDLKSLADLKGKTFMAVDPRSFGGWRMAWRELLDAGVDPKRDFKELRFGGYHDVVVLAVAAGEVDAGTVRTDTLERMESQGRINLGELRVIAPQPNDFVPLLRSTRLYPEWPMARVRHTSSELAEKVAVALLGMPTQAPAAAAAGIDGWTIPENYQPVHAVLRQLRLGPYQDLGKFSLTDVVDRYWPVLSASALLFLSMAIFTFVVLRLNRKLGSTHAKALAEMERRRRVEEERECLLGELQKAMANVKTLSGLLPICAGCKKIRNDDGEWEQVEGYIAKKSEAQFSHGICPECSARLYPELVKKK
jgi:ABC-type phosphate/phosphonate transport system substrate-binding protein